MTLAILTPATRAPAADQGGLLIAGGLTLPDRIRAQLAEAGADEVRTAGPAELADLAEQATGPMLLCAADVVAHTELFRLLGSGPTTTTRALLLPADEGTGALAVGARRGNLVAAPAPTTDSAAPAPTTDSAAPASAASASAAGGPVFGGVLRVGVGDLPALATAARRVADRPGDATRQPLDAILAELVAAGTTVGAYPLRQLVAVRVTDQAGVAAAEAQVRAVDPDRARLRLAVKEHDDLFATYCVSSWSPLVTKGAARLGLSPSGVTAISVLFAGAAALLFAVGDRPLVLLLGAVLLYLGFVLDCVDGQLARYTGRYSAFGGWLDTIADRGKEYLVYAGLGAGVQLSGAADGWLLATAAIVLQTVRHMTDAWYGALHDDAARRVPAVSTEASAPAGVGSRLSQVSDRVLAAPGSLVYWAKRTVVFPIGERWALIAVTAAVLGQRAALLAVLGWGVLAFCYTLALRSLRSRSMRVPVLAAVDTARYRDDGPLARLLAHRVGAVVAAGSGQLPLVGAAVAAATAALLLPAFGVAGGISAVALLAGAGAALAAGIASAARPAVGSLDWLVPAGLRAVEFLIVVAAGAVADVPPVVTYGLLFVLALGHYDLTARLEKRLGAPPLHRWSLGWDGRVLLITLTSAGAALAAATGSGAADPTTLATGATGALAGYLAVHFVATAVLDHRPASAEPGHRPASAEPGQRPASAEPGRRPAAGVSVPAPRRPTDPPVDPAPPFSSAGRPAGPTTGDL
ncbi:DUF5941 domain-containing protein [Solwaraspora sp. WMMD791]|uniref:DUF5941 domain-containing protein n=1 Tax=Solwaraspora sp. WMMD791 TaxID=3016086 RepID=UPI00249A58F3|nr:DUF5941 domain-containing protein [Solwaraspora sp. WMMD791]WFE25257.1 DUF5941 domain-containing protein [Solwaraspora sp. WMMD791]